MQLVDTATTLPLENYMVETQHDQLNGDFSTATLAECVSHSLWKTLWMNARVRDSDTRISGWISTSTTHVYPQTQ